MKRKLLYVLILCLLCITICSCGKKHRNEKSEEVIQGEGVIFYRGDTYTEESLIFDSHTDSSVLKSVFNTESHQSMPYCFDSGCEHHPDKMSLDGTEVLEEGCPAYDYSQQSVFIHGEHMYFFMDRCLYRADLTGMNRQLICSLTKPYTMSERGDCIYTDEALYIPYVLCNELILKTDGSAEEWVLGEKKEKQEAGLLRIPFSGEEEKVIFHSDEYYDMQVVNIWRHDGCICFQVIGRDCPYSIIQKEAGDDFDLQALMTVDLSHSFTEAYDYVVKTGEIKSIAYEKPTHGGFYFFSDVYGIIQDSGKLELHRYSGEMTAETEIPFSGVISDRYVIGYNADNHKGVLLNQEDGKVIKTSPLTWEDFLLEVVVGDSFFGHVGLTRAYLSAEDYWSGNTEGIVLIPEVSDLR